MIITFHALLLFNISLLSSLLPSTYRVPINSSKSINMKVTNLDERIHVLDNESNVMTVIKDIAMSGLQEEAFYVLDIGDIVRKHQIWKEKLPRVEPYYGMLSTFQIHIYMIYDYLCSFSNFQLLNVMTI